MKCSLKQKTSSVKTLPPKVLKFGDPGFISPHDDADDFFEPMVKKGRSSNFQRSAKPVKESSFFEDDEKTAKDEEKTAKDEEKTAKAVKKTKPVDTEDGYVKGDEGKVQAEIDSAYEFNLESFETTEKSEEDIANFVEFTQEDIIKIMVESGVVVSYTFLESLANDLLQPLDFTATFIDEWIHNVFKEMYTQLKAAGSDLAWDTTLIKNSGERAVVNTMVEIVEFELGKFQKKERSDEERSDLIHDVTDELMKILHENKDVEISQENLMHIAEKFMVALDVTDRDKIVEYVNRLQEAL
jgi:hypothetical protein